MSEPIEYLNLFHSDDIKSASVDIQESNANDDNINNKDELKPDNHPIEMPAIAKKTLVYLMRQGVILQSQKPQVFANVLQYQEMIIRHLSEVYLSLIVDERQGVLFIARSDYQETQDEQNNADDEMSDEEDISSLISRRTISIYDSLLLLILRKYYQERENAGEQQIVIDVDKIEGLFLPFSPLTNYKTKERNKLINKLKSFAKSYKILQSIRNSDERFEITPMIRYVVNADFLNAMLSEYEALLQKGQENSNQENDFNDFKKTQKSPKSEKEQTDLLF